MTWRHDLERCHSCNLDLWPLSLEINNWFVRYDPLFFRHSRKFQEHHFLFVYFVTQRKFEQDSMASVKSHYSKNKRWNTARAFRVFFVQRTLVTQKPLRHCLCRKKYLKFNTILANYRHRYGLTFWKKAMAILMRVGHKEFTFKVLMQVAHNPYTELYGLKEWKVKLLRSGKIRKDRLRFTL